MSDTTSPGLDEWSSHTDAARSPSRLQHPAKRRRTESRGHASQEIGLMRNGGKSGLPRFIGSGSGIHFIRTVYDVLARTALGSRSADRSHTQGHVVPGEDDELVGTAPEVVETPGTRSRTPFWRQDEIVEDASPGAPAIDFDNLVQWTKHYFENWHPAFPFLHGPEVLEILEKVASIGLSNISEADATIVRSLVSISIADARQIGATRAAVPTSLVFLNQEHIASSLVFALGCPASLKSIQAAVCVQLFLVSMLKFNMASRLGGIIVRMSFHLGLYRCPARYPNFSTQEASMRKRIWWSIYCLERIVCQALGHPLGIADDDSDVCLPSNEVHGEHPSGAPPGNDPLLYLTLLSKHTRIRGLILELRHKSIAIRHDTVDRAMVVQSELAKWANDVHDRTDDRTEFDNEGTPNVAGSVSISQQTLLTIMHQESIITLFRPLLASDTKSPSSQAALQTCISASRALIDTIIKNNNQQSGKVSQSIMVWPLLTWSVWMSCFILTYAALEHETTISSAQKYAKKALYILRQLSARDTTWPESCAQGVEHLVSALKKRQEENSISGAEKGSFPTLSNERHQTRSSTSFDKRNHMQMLQQENNPIDNQQSSGVPSATQPLRNGQQLSSPAVPATSLPQEDLTPQHRTPLDSAQFTPSQSQFSMAEGLSAVDLYSQEWFDPLGALDFSTFAQVGTTDSTLGFGFF